MPSTSIPPAQKSLLVDDPFEVDSNIGYMATGITLFHTDESDVVLARVIKLFSLLKQQPQASQILMCRPNTSFEEINCFLFRCCHHNKSSEQKLYCLVQPESLRETVTDETLQILFKTLRNTQNFFTVITADKKSKWYSYLQIYNDVLEPLTENQRAAFYKKYIGTDLETFIKGLRNPLSAQTSTYGDSLRADHLGPIVVEQQNPLCKVYMSVEECVGKTHEIKRLCKENKDVNFHLVHIPFNSPKVDKDFVVSRMSDGLEKVKDKSKVCHALLLWLLY